MPIDFKKIIGDLSRKYDVSLPKIRLVMERAFIVVLQRVFKADWVEFVWDDEMPYVVIYRNGRGRELTPDDVTPSLIVQIKRLIPKYMAIEKADMLLKNIKYLEGTLIMGFIEAVEKDHIKVNHDDIPAYFHYPLINQPLQERTLYKPGQTYLFYVKVKGSGLFEINGKIVAKITLSRTDKRIPELFFKKETDIDVICLKREYDRKKRFGTAYIKTKHRIPFPVIEKYSKEFNESVKILKNL